jgi:hypothetical protein
VSKITDYYFSASFITGDDLPWDDELIDIDDEDDF